MLRPHMSSDDTARPTTPAASLKNIKFFLWGVSVDFALVCAPFLLSVLMSLLFCPARGCADFYGRVEYGFKAAATMEGLLLIYFWYILIPAAAVPPLVGLIVDY